MREAALPICNPCRSRGRRCSRGQSRDSPAAPGAASGGLQGCRDPPAGVHVRAGEEHEEFSSCRGRSGRDNV